MPQELYSNGPYQSIEEDYDLGSFVIQPTEGVYQPIETKLRGTITYPSNSLPSKAPLIILAHGRHTASVENFRGLLYLAHHLSTNGYVCASIDLNDLVGPQGTRVSKKPPIVVGGAIFHRAKTILHTIVKLKTHPVVGTLANFKNVGLIGHSRGAEAVARAGAMSEEGGNVFGIRSVFSIAPVDFSGVHLGLPFFLLYGDLDADVSDGQSFRVWDRSSSNKHGFYIQGGIHNYFSSNWKNEWDSENPRTISRTAHEKIAKACSFAFFEHYLKDNREHEEFLSSSKLPGDISEIDVSRLYRSTDEYKIDAFEGVFDPSTNSLGLPSFFEGTGEMLELDMERFNVNTDGLANELSTYYQYHEYLTDPRYVQYYDYIKNELSRMSGAFISIFQYFVNASQRSASDGLVQILKQALSTFSISPEGWELLFSEMVNKPLSGLLKAKEHIDSNSAAIHALNHVGKGLLVNWTGNDATYKTNLGGKNISNYRWLSFRVGQLYNADKDSLLNPDATQQSFTVVLVDKDGQQSAVHSAQIDGAIDYPKDDQSDFKSNLRTLLLPVSSFIANQPNINTSAINELRIVFNQVGSGSLVIDDISLTN